jgi:hypothetical protein
VPFAAGGLMASWRVPFAAGGLLASWRRCCRPAHVLLHSSTPTKATNHRVLCKFCSCPAQAGVPYATNPRRLRSTGTFCCILPRRPKLQITGFYANSAVMLCDPALCSFSLCKFCSYAMRPVALQLAAVQILQLSYAACRPATSRCANSAVVLRGEAIGLGKRLHVGQNA